MMKCRESLLKDDKREYKKKVYAVDLFCGAGGLTKGLEDAGIDVRIGIDIDPACEYPYSVNTSATFLHSSVATVSGEQLSEYYRKNGIRLLAGCAPCQTFSTYNKKAKKDDKRWWLLLEFGRIVEELSPELVTMENVPGLIDQDVFTSFVAILRQRRYHVSYSIVDCAEYGIPQTRRRLVLLASKFGPISLLSPSEFGSKPKTVKQAIGNLPRLVAGQMDPHDPLHQAAGLSQLNLERIKASKIGGTWRDWDASLVASCHKKTTGGSYPSVYGRMSWSEPAPTMTTQFFGFGNGRFGHPEQDRALTLREGAILQTFPPDYKFVPPGAPIHKSTIGRLIGNAVPVKLGEVIGRSILNHVRDMGTRAKKLD